MLTIQDSTRRSMIWLAVILAMAAIAAVDLMQPVGFVFAMAYVAIVVIVYQNLTPKQALVITATCSFATFAGVFVEGTNSTPQEEIIERVLVLCSLWLVAFFMHRRRRLNAELGRSQAKYQAIFDGVADGILMVDSVGTIDSANPAAARMLGYTPGDLDGMQLDTVVPHEYRESHRHSVAEYVAGRLDIAHLIGVSREVEALRRDGTVFPIEINVSVAQQSSGQMFSAVIRDVTERRESERIIR